MNVPNANAWRSETWGLGTEHAFSKFKGKTLDDAFTMFASNAIAHVEDLLYMPSQVFRYYVGAFVQYLVSDVSKNDSGAASGFVSLLLNKLESRPDDLKAIWSKAQPAVERILLEPDFFDIDPLIDGDLRSRLRSLERHGYSLPAESVDSHESQSNGVTASTLALMHRTLPSVRAIPILAQSGINGIPSASTEDGVKAVLGAPCRHGTMHINQRTIRWMLFRQNDCLLRFEFEAGRLNRITFMPPGELDK